MVSQLHQLLCHGDTSNSLIQQHCVLPTPYLCSSNTQVCGSSTHICSSSTPPDTPSAVITLMQVLHITHACSYSTPMHVHIALHLTLTSVVFTPTKVHIALHQTPLHVLTALYLTPTCINPLHFHICTPSATLFS